MKYQVSDKIQEKFEALTKDERVQKALAFMEEDHEQVIEKQIELTLIPAPTYHEEKKAARLLEMFKEEGLTDCHIDEYGNCVGIRKGPAAERPLLWKPIWIRFLDWIPGLRLSGRTDLSNVRESLMIQEGVRLCFR